MKTKAALVVSDTLPRFCSQCGTDFGEPSSYLLGLFLKGDHVVRCTCGAGIQFAPEKAIAKFSELQSGHDFHAEDIGVLVAKETRDPEAL